MSTVNTRKLLVTSSNISLETKWPIPVRIKGVPDPCRIEAIERGETTFISGRKCKRGHIGPRDVKTSTCIECHRQIENERYMQNKESIKVKNKAYQRAHKDQVRNRMRQNKYGVTAEQYDTRLKEQNFCCAACGDKLDLAKNTHQDHCYATNTARGVLCHWCNLAVGNVKDSIERAEKIVAYLRKWEVLSAEF